MHSKGNCQQNEKTTYGMGESIVSDATEGVNIKNMQRVHAIQHQKTNEPIKK